MPYTVFVLHRMGCPVYSDGEPNDMYFQTRKFYWLKFVLLVLFHTHKEYLYLDTSLYPAYLC